MRIRRHISYANVVSTMALVFALAGGAVAATHMAPRNSVDSRSIKNNSVRTNDVRNGSLRAKDFKTGELPAGAKGDKGDPGSALGYAYVSYLGVIDPAVSTSNVTVTHPGAGEYCVALTGATATTAVATIEFGNSATTTSVNSAQMSHIEVVPVGKASNDCPAGQVKVLTFMLSGSSGAGTGIGLALFNSSFVIAIL